MTSYWRSAYFIFFLLIAVSAKSFAQSDTQVARLKIALFTPLYLDSAFDAASNYRYGMNFPKYINAGLEFYEGMQEAADTLEKEGMPLDLIVYDSRSAQTSVQQILSKNLLDSIDLIIGHVTGNEAKLLANTASKKNIPFINANYPNDAGITNNPDFVILNTTLYTHCAGMYKFIQKNYPLAPVVVFRKKGAQEDRLKNYFEQITQTTSSVSLKMKYVTLDEQFTVEDVRQHLNEDATTIVIAGSLDINFANTLTQDLSSIYTTHQSVLFGMPTWWDATNFTKPEFKGVEVFVTTPFYVSPIQPLVVHLTDEFKTRYYSKPTDMYFRGYETLYHFAHLLKVTGKNFGSSFSDKRFRVFTDFDIQPVINPKTTTLDYFENKKIYFVKKVDGIVTAIY